MIVMVVLYTLIICKMYKNNTAMRMRSFQSALIEFENDDRVVFVLQIVI